MGYNHSVYLPRDLVGIWLQLWCSQALREETKKTYISVDCWSIREPANPRNTIRTSQFYHPLRVSDRCIPWPIDGRYPGPIQLR